MDTQEWLSGLLDACEDELRGRIGAVAAFMRKRHGGDQLSMVRDARRMFVENVMDFRDEDDEGAEA